MDKVIATLKQYWYIFIALLVLIILTVLYTLYFNKSNEVTSLKSQINIQQNIEKTDKLLDPIKNREDNIYPQIEKRQQESNQALKLLEDKRSKIKIKQKGEIEDEIKKLNTNDTSKLFNDLGYNNSVMYSK